MSQHYSTGKRSVKVGKIKTSSYNLCSQIEYGEPLRVLEITKEGTKVLNIKNPAYNKYEKWKNEQPKKPEKSQLVLLKEMVKSKDIKVKNLKDNVISLNFDRQVFEKRIWTDLTCTARGLFVDKTNGEVVACSFNKFFNYGERPETESGALKTSLKFPVTAYKKENGFLGLISKYNNEVRIFTKSSDDGPFVHLFIGVLCEHFNIVSPANETYESLYKLAMSSEVLTSEAALDQLRTRLKERLKPLIEEGKTYILECVDIKNDPHMIDYPHNDLFLIGARNNNLNDEFMDYKTLCEMAFRLTVKVKEKSFVLNNWEEFDEFKTKFRGGISSWDCKHEGYVMEDQNGFNIKFKSRFYSFWKHMRTIKNVIQTGGNPRKTYVTKEEIEVIKLLQSYDKEELKNLSIIDVQKKFYETYEG